MKKILVIGGTGFIGQHICKKLSKKNSFKVYSLSLNGPRLKKKIKGVLYLKQNLLKKKFKINLKNKNYDVIINASGYSGNFPSYYKGKNINTTHYKIIKNILNNINTKKKIKLIHLGSSSEYGQNKSPIKETFQCKPKNTYGKSKFKCSNYILNFRHKNLKYIIFRLFQVYGEHQKQDKLIPYVIEKSKKNLEFKVSSGKQIRDYLHVDDLVDAIYKAIFSKKAECKIINLGSGSPVTVKKIINIICSITKTGKPKFGALKINPGESQKIYPSIKRAKAYLNWIPKVKLRSGIKRIIENF
jgi:nucleoside-diphosphate-sugar epimerase